MKALKFAASAAAVVLAVGAVPVTSFLTNPERTQNITAAADVFGVFEYENYGSYIEITKYTGSATEVEIPDNIDGIPVTAIADGQSYSTGSWGYTYEGVFLGTKVVSVTIPESVTKIGVYAFRNCDSLTSVEIPSSVTSIGASAFYDCDSLTSVVIPDSVETLGNYAFNDCDNLNTVTVGAKSIGSYAFSETPKLTSVIITDNVYSIGSKAFEICTNLETIVFPDSVKEMGGGMFNGCSSLKNVTLPKEITSLSYWDARGFFQGCTSLKKIVIPYYVTSIGDSCFYNVPLESITIGARLTDFTNLPLDCETLKEIIVVDENRNYSSVDGVLFNKDQTELVRYPQAKADEEYTVPKTVATVTQNAFNGNSSIKKVTLPENVTNIYDSAFYNCAKLEDIIFLNPKCEIYDYSDTVDENTYINGYTGSTAEAYANKYNKQFVSMGLAPSETTTAATTTTPQTTTTTAVTSTPSVTTTPDDDSSNLQDWQKAYIHEIENYKKTWTDSNGAKDSDFSYALLYIDNNDIPELIMCYNTLQVGQVLSFRNGDVVYIDDNMGGRNRWAIKYKEKSGKYMGFSSGSAWQVWYNIYDISEGTPTLVDSLWTNLKDSKDNSMYYYLNDTEISENEWNEKYKQYENDFTEITYCTYVEIIKQIKDINSPSPDDDLLFGDVNEDGAVDASDASLILAYYSYMQTGGNGGLKEFRDNMK